eukprot:TRINITY_DN636_c0_g2_i1.p1 TRINITY_DN636_c0_g2~~TRINITY_DN636_c0_g2_i1.p1  ORF type:complete len:388 (-),score=37.24 TRINITY_DN636_c0_g2_i1:154-1263(-)
MAESTKKPICAAPGCGKFADLQCPKCLSLGLPSTAFCSQDCFKAAWPVHKTTHGPATPASDGLPQIFAGYKFTGPLRPGFQSPRRPIPPHIPRPDYAETGEPRSERAARGSTAIEVKTPEQIQAMRTVCRMGREVLDEAARAVKPGVTTDEIDRIVHEATIARGAYPSTMNYINFPKSCCTSVNEVICHGIPDSRPLENGDIVNLDISLYFGGVHADLNETYFVGEVDAEAKRLVQASYDSLQLAIANVKPGVMYRELGNVIQNFASKQGFSVVRSVVGHGIGKLFHTTPNIPHYAKNKAIGVMKPGHTFTVEPMINEGVWQDVTWPDDWTMTTRDGKRSAQFEHTLLVTETGVEILTARLAESPRSVS